MAKLLFYTVSCVYEEKWSVSNYLHFTIHLDRYFRVEKQILTYMNTQRLNSCQSAVYFKFVPSCFLTSGRLHTPARHSLNA